MIMAQNKNLEDFLLDKQRVRSSFDLAANRYDEVAVLQREIGQRMAERLDLVRITPQRILDAGAGTGSFSRSLSQRYPQAHVIALDISHAMLRRAHRITSARSIWRRLPYIGKKFSKQLFACGDIEQLPLTADAVDLIFSNLTLQWCNDLEQVFAGFRRILVPGGLLMFSTFGPDTLKELRECWSRIDHFTHVNTFIDMHDIGDALLRHGFSEPVMDVERITLTYTDIKSLMHDLKSLGAHNVTRGRRQTLTGKGRIKALMDAYESYRRDGVLPASYEVVYGHAWAGTQKSQVHGPAHEARIPLSQLRDRSRSV
jgi:malonyl-CoA O-methyltransferase